MLELKAPFDEINNFRLAIGLRPIIKRHTVCLACRKGFESHDYPRQRLCKNCRTNTDDFLSYDTPGQDLMLVG